jgi:hypothetical protein
MKLDFKIKDNELSIYGQNQKEILIPLQVTDLVILDSNL